MTNPPVPATPLDVEACAHLLPIIAAWHQNEMFGMHDCALREFHEEVVKLAGALASALPGMGKKAEWYDWLAEEDHVDWSRRLGNGNFAIETPPFGMKPDIERATLGECIDAARAAQPGETSADG